jgi:hypothetical protein
MKHVWLLALVALGMGGIAMRNSDRADPKVAGECAYNRSANL